MYRRFITSRENNLDIIDLYVIYRYM